MEHLPIMTLRKALEQIAMLRLTSSGSNEGRAIGIARDILEINGEDFESYKKRKPEGIDTFLLRKMSKADTKSFLQNIQDMSMEIEARLLPDDIETRKQYLENLDKLVKELIESIQSQKKIKPINLAIVFATIGIAIATTNECI